MSENEPPAHWLKSISETVGRSVNSIMDSKMQGLVDRVAKVEDAQQAVTMQIKTFDARLQKMESAGLSSSMASTMGDDQPLNSDKIELKGWCTAVDKKEHGKTRLEAANVVSELTECLPTELKSQVGETTLFGPKNANALIRVDKSVITEVLGYWKQHLAEKMVDDEERRPGVRLEIPLWRKKANGLLARALNFAEAHASKQQATVKPFWNPDFALTVQFQGDQRFAPLAELDKPTFQTIKWHQAALKLFNLQEIDDVQTAMKLHRRT
eukprot:TRINITY_DN18749_c0_g1_i1.p1 TRINITY_DN18749_c0_g1~~TRINITY_DN18749_c0_g1_i1.p1  ORF type:complete len:268 (+),score=72.65 TRINITY_DN18749_c0_g1_i1:199-1002(+)